MLFSTTALPKLRALQHLASRPVLPHSSLLDLGDATAVGCARRKLSCFKLRAPAFALVASRLDSSSTSPPLPSNTALHSTPSVKHAGLLPPHPDSARPFESLPSPSPSTWRHSLGEAPLCREPDFNSIDGLSHPKEETVSLLRNPELVMCPAGRVELLAPLPACNMLAEKASYLIIVSCQVYPALSTFSMSNSSFHNVFGV